jgi:very-short-patch-repair endonuclease
MHHMGASDSDLSPDMRLAALAAAQFGVFDRADAAACGLGRGAMARRIERGRWVRLHAGVYALGHAQLRIEGRWLAAVRACGAGAVLSHGDAAAAWDLVVVAGTRVAVTIPPQARRNPDPRRIRVRARALVSGIDTTTLGPIAITTVGRTLLDLAEDLTERRLEAAISEADLRGVYDGREVRAVLAAHPTRRGSAKLNGILAELAGVGVPRTRSEMEIRLRELCDACHLPQPAVNAVVDGKEVDAYWPAADLIVETDGWAFHRMPGRREADAAKRLALEAAGHRVVVLTWAQITGRPRATADALRRLLANRS